MTTSPPIQKKTGASIFDDGNPIGVIPDESGDYWVRDMATASWTRFITVPRKEFYHPSEGERGPDLSTLHNTRLTIPSLGRSIKDDWRATAVNDGPTASSSEELWVGKCVFYETFDEASELEEIGRVDRAVDLPGGLVFTDIAEYSLTDNLSGEALDGPLVTMA